MEVEQEWDAGEPQRQRGERQEVRQGVDLDDGVAATPVRLDQGEARPGEELEVLAEIDPERRALVPLDVEPADTDAGHVADGRVLGPAEREHVHRSARGDERLRLAAHPRILLVVAVGQHRDRPAGR